MSENRGDGGQFILGATLGDCVHVAGVLSFLRLAESQGYRTHFMGTRTSVEELMEAALESDPDIIALSFRLSPEVAGELFADVAHRLREAGLGDKRLVFGGTAPVCRVAEESGIFDATFDGNSTVDEVLSYLGGGGSSRDEVIPPQDLIARIEARAPHPIIRHHYGRPTMKETEKGISEIAESGLLDIISIGPDQNAQASFFRPEERDPRQDGAGGVPVRSPDDFRRLWNAAQRGNYPLLRCYSGTRDVEQFAEVLLDTIDNAWAAIPLYWYNVLDGRGPREVEVSIRESRELMRWHAEHQVPVEVNEAHHWSLRDAPDVIAVAAAYLAALNAKDAGVKDYIAQFMFNTPPGTSFGMDVAKMLAKLDLISELEDEDFRVWRQVRTGLFSFPADPDMARGQLAYSTVAQMTLKPHIVHVVGYTEADHAADAREVIESVKITRQVIKESLFGLPDPSRDPAVANRRQELVREARLLLDAIRALDPGKEDALTDPTVLARAVRLGLMDAPHLAGNPAAAGRVETRMIDGACYAVDPDTGHPVDEKRRLKSLGK
ncbi:MAG: cobalamin-dependent protein [Bacillota bacterium]